MVHEWSDEHESYASGSIATGGVFIAGQVKGCTGLLPHNTNKMFKKPEGGQGSVQTVEPVNNNNNNNNLVPRLVSGQCTTPLLHI
jgi:hypothetical protein